jgi:predicted lipid-binding transport protein (Tim44 family)
MFTGLALSLALATTAVPPQPRPITEYLERAAWTASALPAPAVASRRGDPLKNGAIIGAVVGGIVGGVGIGLLCHAFNDTGDPICWKATLLYAGIGAGVGAGIGAGVDALFQRRTTFVASVRF